MRRNQSHVAIQCRACHSKSFSARLSHESTRVKLPQSDQADEHGPTIERCECELDALTLFTYGAVRITASRVHSGERECRGRCGVACPLRARLDDRCCGLWSKLCKWNVGAGPSGRQGRGRVRYGLQMRGVRLFCARYIVRFFQHVCHFADVSQRTRPLEYTWLTGCAGTEVRPSTSPIP